MNLSTKLLIILFIMFAVIFLSAETVLIDSANISTQVIQYDDDFDGAPGLGIFVLLTFAFILICVGIGIVLAILLLLFIFGLIGAGILSISILVGLNKKSFSKGFKILLIGSSTIGGLIVGISGFCILNKITHWWTFPNSLLIGSGSGLISGFLFGLFLFYVLQKLTTFLLLKLDKNWTEKE